MGVVMPVQMGCCEAKQAMQECCECKRQISSLVAISSSDAKQIAVLEDKVGGLTALSLFCVIIAAAAFGSCFYVVDQSKQRLQRLEKIVGMDEIGRRK